MVEIMYILNESNLTLARWSRGMIRASGARGPGFKSRSSPEVFKVWRSLTMSGNWSVTVKEPWHGDMSNLHVQCKSDTTPVGLEPTASGLEVRRAIHCATGSAAKKCLE